MASTSSHMAPSVESRGRRVRRIRSPTPTFGRQWNLLLVSSSDDTHPTIEAPDITVTRCATAQESMSILQGGAVDFVLVDTDVDDRFKLVKRIAKHTDVCVAMMSSSRNEEVMRKGFEKGACDFFVKPINVEDLRNRMLHSRPAAVQGRTQVEDHAPPSKRPRVIWVPELHSKFVEAVNLLGITKAVPKKILEIMNVPGLTRENVASHLQKYRQHCRKREENSQKQVTGVLVQGATFDPRPPPPVLPPMRLLSLTGRPETRVFECGVGANQTPRAYSECRNLYQEHGNFGHHVQPFDDVGYNSLVSSINSNSQTTLADNVDFYVQHHQYSVDTYGANVYQPPLVQHHNNQPAVGFPEQYEQICVADLPPFNASLWIDFVSPQTQNNHPNCFDDCSAFRPLCPTTTDFIEHQVGPPDTNASTVSKEPVNQFPNSDQLTTNQDNEELQEFNYMDVAAGFDWSN